MRPSAAVRITGVWKQYGGPSPSFALKDVSLEIPKGQVVALYGRSGSGKSTLLNLIAGLDRPTRGTIQVEGKDLETLGEHGRTILRRKSLGFVFQFFNLLPTLTALENVLLSLELIGESDKSKAREALRNLGLEGKEQRYPHELSGGEQQRVAIARALVKRPSLILADEPTGNLDTQTGDQVLDMLASQCREVGATLLMATHSPKTSRVCDRVLRMVDGRLVEDRPPGFSASSGNP